MSTYTADELAAARLVGDYWLRKTKPAPLPDADTWPAITQAAITQGLGPLLFIAVQDWRRADNIPSTVVDRLRLAYMRTLHVNTRRFAALDKLLAEFNADKIQVVLLKGCALAPTLYGDIGLRVISDIDVLVSSDDLSRARAALTRLGYLCEQGMHDDAYLLENMGEVTYKGNGADKAVVDLHWRLIHVPGFSHQIDTAWFQSNLKPATVANQPTHVLEVGAQVLHCAVHYHLHHIGGSLKWTFDVALLLARHGKEIQWPSLHAFCRRTDTVTPVTIMLEHVATLWQIDIPAEALRAGFHPNRNTLNWRMRLRVLNSPLRHIYLGLRNGRIVDGFRYTKSVIFPSRAYLEKRYGLAPGASALPYYFKRLGAGMREVIDFALRRR